MQDNPPETIPAGALLIEQRRGRIAVLTLDRPAQRNCLSEGLLLGLQQAIDRISTDPEVAVAVVAANGPVFSSGHDLKEMAARRSDPDGGLAYYAYLMDICARMMLSIIRSPKPFIAAVEGVATAAGC